MSDLLHERLNQILPKVTSDDFLSGRGLGNEIAFYIFDYPPEDELRVRDYLRTLLDHLPKQRPGLRVQHVNLFDFVWITSRVATCSTKRSRCSATRAMLHSRRPSRDRSMNPGWAPCSPRSPSRSNTT
jgi:hypothetical protein